MSLLDDARRLAEHGYEDSYEDRHACPFCGLCGGHDENCPWHAMPRIVAALEAAQMMLTAQTAIEQREGFDMCLACDQDHGHARDCPRQALVKAMEGGA